MTENDLHDDLDKLAVEVEQKITENQKTLEEQPDFAPRSDRSRKLRRKIEKDS